MSVAVISPPEALVAAQDAKAWAPVLADDDDSRVDALLAVSQAALEPPNGWVGRAFGRQTLEARFSGFRTPCVFLPCPPLRELVSITYRDATGDDRTLAPEMVRVLGVGTLTGSISPRSGRWPTTDFTAESVRVQFKAGYEKDSPEILPVRHAIVLGAVQLRSLSTQDLSLRSREIMGVGTRTWTVSDAAAQLVRRAVDELLSPFRTLRV